jgi:hypothetical protein
MGRIKTSAKLASPNHHPRHCVSRNMNFFGHLVVAIHIIGEHVAYWALVDNLIAPAFVRQERTPKMKSYIRKKQWNFNL